MSYQTSSRLAKLKLRAITTTCTVIAERQPTPLLPALSDPQPKIRRPQRKNRTNGCASSLALMVRCSHFQL